MRPAVASRSGTHRVPFSRTNTMAMQGRVAFGLLVAVVASLISNLSFAEDEFWDLTVDDKMCALDGNTCEPKMMRFNFKYAECTAGLLDCRKTANKTIFKYMPYECGMDDKCGCCLF